MKVYSRFRFTPFILSGFPGLLLASAGAVSSGSSLDQTMETTERPDMLERVDRRPGILAPPSELPEGDQAGIYLDLLETDPENTRFREEWEERLQLQD